MQREAELLRDRDTPHQRDKRLKSDPPELFLSSFGKRAGKIRKRLCQNSKALLIQ